MKKCKYSKCHCLHSTVDIEDEEAVKEKNSYYHADCLKTKNDILELIDIWAKQINPDVVFNQLRRTIDNIVFNEKKATAEYLLFGVKYYIGRKIPLRYPGGLYYVLQNQDVKKAYQLKKSAENKPKVETKIDEPSSSFVYKTAKISSFADILNQ